VKSHELFELLQWVKGQAEHAVERADFFAGKSTASYARTAAKNWQGWAEKQALVCEALQELMGIQNFDVIKGEERHENPLYVGETSTRPSMMFWSLEYNWDKIGLEELEGRLTYVRECKKRQILHFAQQELIDAD
jgi:hypothetical protein